MIHSTILARHGLKLASAGAVALAPHVAQMQTPPSSLQSQLDARAAASADRVPAEARKKMMADAKALAASQILQGAKNVGDEAPDFTLPNAVGEPVTLSQLLENGPVVLTWYRGGWCPYCNLQLRYLQQVLPQFQDTGAQLVAISPEKPDNSLATKEKHDLDFHVLSDLGNAVAQQYGVVFTLSEEVHELYNDWFEFDTWNGNDSGELPLAATYVIDTDGTIAWAFLETDYRKRAEPEAILDAVRNL